MINRRDFLRVMATGGAMLAMPKLALAKANTNQRFIFVMQRGAADGLNIVIPYADPNYAKLLKSLAIDASQAVKLDSLFALHPALKQTAKLYTEGQALFVQAVASPYRQRSHFDAQNVLETGGNSPYQLKDGWMNRLLTLLAGKQKEAIAIAQSVPMALRGNVQVASYAPSKLPDAAEDLMLRVTKLYENDDALHAAWTSAMEVESMAAHATKKRDPAGLGKLTGGFLVREDGPRIAMLESNGWDTHSNQNGRLNRQLSGLDGFIASLKETLGDTWQQTTVLVCTEFGRTAAVNGTQGTDHGTASAAMLYGGGLKGGRVLADWPGLNNASLYQGRDLMPTLGLDTLITSVVAELYGLDPYRVRRVLFPQGSDRKALEGFYHT
jgi:uncharacterized protein (DUF1501 family)